MVLRSVLRVKLKKQQIEEDISSEISKTSIADMINLLSKYPKDAQIDISVYQEYDDYSSLIAKIQYEKLESEDEAVMRLDSTLNKIHKANRKKNKMKL